MTTKEKIDIMLEYLNGKTIQRRSTITNSTEMSEWEDCVNEPNWDWGMIEYRVKPTNIEASITIPSVHGRIIDEHELNKAVKGDFEHWAVIRYYLKDIPALVEASEGIDDYKNLY